MVGSVIKWVIGMFVGEYHHNIDAKGRLIIPSKFRDELGENFMITRGLDGCLFVYPNNEWTRIVTKLKALPFTKKDARDFMRFFLSGASECEIDTVGRVNIATPLVEYAKLNKECVIIGVNDRLEIWAKDKWDGFLETNEDQFANIAENLIDFDIEL